MKVIFIPGNGGGTTSQDWFAWLRAELELLGVEVLAEEFPDPEIARGKYWLPFIESLGTDEDTVLVGISSGAIAAMRYAENHNILGSILVGTYHTDLNEENEKKSGYFDKVWRWGDIKENQKWTAVFASTDDPWIPIEEERYVKDKLGSDYFEYADRGHFMVQQNPVNDKFPELLKYLKAKLSL